MNEIQPLFGTLEDVPVRSAWKHEALGLTPWVAANLDRLGSVLGMQLELEGTERAVESFAADILARDVAGDRLVLIENQLEQSDHKHLGQIMTYLAGLDSEVMVWVATDFSDAHLSAIRWLNEHTVEPFAFFAVRLRVVRIGDSPLAPLFDVVERPNDWDRQLEQQARETRQVSPAGQRRRAFWANYSQRFPNAAPSDFIGGGGSSRWLKVPNSDLVISRWLSKGGVGIFIRSGRGIGGAATVERLRPYQRLLEELLEVPMGQKEFPFLQELQGSVSDETRWDEMADWIHEKSNEYETALKQILRAEASSVEDPAALETAS